MGGEDHIRRGVLLCVLGAAVLICGAVALVMFGRLPVRRPTGTPPADASTRNPRPGPQKDRPCEWQWRGPKRGGKSPEAGLLRKWPDDGPKLLWTADGCGLGFANVTIAEGTIYTAGTFDGQTFILAFDMDGKPRWKTPNGERWTTPPREAAWVGGRYDGARAAPTVDDGMVYHLGALGRLAAYDAATGAERWSVRLPGVFEADIPLWGYSEHVLIDGRNLICYPGGRKGYMVALDKKTGEVIWRNTSIGDPAGNASATLADDRGVRQLITMTRVSVVGVDADTGRLLWRIERDNGRDVKVDTPVYDNGAVYVSDGYKFGGELIRLRIVGKKVTAKVDWSTPEADSLHSGPILHDGHVYGVGYNTRRWFCLDVETGKIRYTDTAIRIGSLTFADGMLYCLGARGTMWLVEPSPEKLKIVSSFRVPRQTRSFLFAHPVVFAGRLYLRAGDRLYAYDLRADTAQPAP